MNFTHLMTDEAILAELGQRLARVRLERNMTQGELAAKAGVSKRTVERLESGGEGGEGTRLSALIRVCRALEMLDRLEGAFPEPVASPIQLMKLAGRQRKRATGTRAASEPEGGGSKPWTWDDKK